MCARTTHILSSFGWKGKSVLLNGKSGLIVLRFFDDYSELELARLPIVGVCLSVYLSRDGSEQLTEMNENSTVACQ